MIIKIYVPSPGESVHDAELSSWLVKDGDFVKRNSEIAEIESDKATLTIVAEEDGIIRFLVKQGSQVSVGAVIGEIDTEKKSHEKADIVKPAPTTVMPTTSMPSKGNIKVTPLARSLMNANNLSVEDILRGLQKIGRHEVEMVISSAVNHASEPPVDPRGAKVEKLSSLRKKLRERLVYAKNQTAMLTTFNEVNMAAVMAIRQQMQDEFLSKYGVKLGYMSFFIKAVTESLKVYPKMNARMQSDYLVFPDYIDISIAVQTDKGLMVPVIRNTHTMTMGELEQHVSTLAAKARSFKLSISEMEGGTFTITNGGIYGSLMSTPILNPPQVAILGMHKITDRPVVVNGQIKVQPVMVVALSYDHRVVDGKDAVTFLEHVCKLLENSDRLVKGEWN